MTIQLKTSQARICFKAANDDEEMGEKEGKLKVFSDIPVRAATVLLEPLELVTAVAVVVNPWCLMCAWT